MKLGIHIIAMTANHPDGSSTVAKYAVIAESSEHAIERLKREHDEQGWNNFASSLSYGPLGPPHDSIVCLDGEIWNARLAKVCANPHVILDAK